MPMKGKKSTILIVDDEPYVRKMLNIFLDASSFAIQECGSGKDALQMCGSVKPDLMLLDLGLPDMDGKQVITDVRQWSQLPIIVLSVRAQDDEIVAALDAGANDYVTKPFNADILMARINANLRKMFTGGEADSSLTN